MRKEKTSFRYKLINALFRVLNVKRMLDKQGKEFQKLLEKQEKKQEVPLKVPRAVIDHYDVEKRNIGGILCYCIKQKNRKPDIAILYCFGGGYIMPPDSGDLVLCGQMADQCNAEVWFPLYPMAPKHRLIETVSGCCAIYQKMLKTYDPADVRFFGTSSGGSLALAICQYIAHENLNVPMPQKLVLQSPGLQVPPSEKQKMRMEELKDRDVMIPPGFFERIAPVLAAGEDVYLLSPLLFDLTGFPAMDVFYGTNEVMIAYLPDMKDVCRKYGIDLKVHIGEGMMHCWGAMGFVPEAKNVRQEYFEALQ